MCHSYDGKGNVSVQPPAIAVIPRVNISMVSLKWGEVLSTLLPGVVALYAIAPYFPTLKAKVDNINGIGWEGGLLLLMASALAGGVLEAFNRITWEKFVLAKLCRSVDALSSLTPENLELYERGVQSSYKYSTFYANFAWAMLLLLGRRVDHGLRIKSVEMVIIAGTVAVLLVASYVQWTYYVNYLRKVFRKEKRGLHAEE